MAMLVHLTPAKNARRIRRSGLAAVSRHRSTGTAGVFCGPLLPSSYTLSYQWLRELRRGGKRAFVAVHFRVPDQEPVSVGHYGDRLPYETTAARAIGLIQATADPRGYEIFLPRAVRPAELHRIRHVSQVTGWRYQPGSHGSRPCACPVCLAAGTFKAAQIRARYSKEPDAPGKPQLMAALREAAEPGQIVDALWALAGAGRRWGGAEELAYLVDHPVAQVREALAEALWSYRGRAAEDLLAALRTDLNEDIREAATPASG